MIGQHLEGRKMASREKIGFHFSFALLLWHGYVKAFIIC